MHEALPVQNFLRHLGTVRNELLIFVLLGDFFFVTVAAALMAAQPVWKNACGIALVFFSFVVFVGFGVFYARTVSGRVPSSDQELAFMQAAEEFLEKDRATRRRRSGD